MTIYDCREIAKATLLEMEASEFVTKTLIQMAEFNPHEGVDAPKGQKAC